MENLSEIERLTRKVAEVQRRAEEAEKREQKEKEERQKAEQREQKAEEELQETTLTEYLSLCHKYLSKSISVQTDKSLSTQGDLSNADGKLRPDYLQPWEDFLDIQKRTLESLFSIYPLDDMPRAFDSRNSIKTQGKNVALRKLASEQDLQNLQHNIVETPVSLIVEHLKSLNSIRDEFGLAGGITFYNHLNPLSNDADEVAQRLEAQQLGPSTPPHSAPFTSRPRPDQICVYTTVDGLNKPAFVVEYKAPHKLTLAHLRHILRPDCSPMELNKIINGVSVPSPQDTMAHFEYRAERLVAAVVTQTFSYMVGCGTQYGYITTGEAFVFLHIKLEDPTTVYYHLAEPNEDVIAQNEAFSNTEDYLHRTAISQVLAFSVLALESAQENREWREGVVKTLEKWEVDYKAILKGIPETPETADKSSPFLSVYRPQTYSLDVPDRSPMHHRLRPRKTTCRPGSDPTSQGDQDPPPSTDDVSSPLDTPTRSQGGPRGKQGQRGRPPTGAGSSSRGGQRRAFCTQLCLQGLARGGPLDRWCPNVSNHCEEGHRGDRHQLDGEGFRMLLGEQLRWSRGDACQPLGMQGARGALFKVTLTSHGYTVVGKGTVLAFVKDLRHEAEVYRRLTKVQGVHVPIYLGSIDLNEPYYYDAGIRIVHLMLLSWAGECLDGSRTITDTDGQRWTSDLVRAVNAIHGAGVLHQDIRMPNLLWNEETKRVMVIDFERAEIVKAVRRALSPMSPNRKRKRTLGAKEVDDKDNMVDMMKKDHTMRSRVALDILAARMMFTSTVPIMAKYF